MYKRLEVNEYLVRPISTPVFCSSLLECIFGYIPFSRRRDTVRYSGIQLDTARYS